MKTIEQLIAEAFSSELGQQCNSLFSTSDNRIFIRFQEALAHSKGELGAGIGNKNCLGRKLSEETKNKLRKANKYKRKTLHISSGNIYSSLKEACKELNLSYANEYYKLKRGTNKTFAYLL